MRLGIRFDAADLGRPKTHSTTHTGSNSGSRQSSAGAQPSRFRRLLRVRRLRRLRAAAAGARLRWRCAGAVRRSLPPLGLPFRKAGARERLRVRANERAPVGMAVADVANRNRFGAALRRAREGEPRMSVSLPPLGRVSLRRRSTSDRPSSRRFATTRPPSRAQATTTTVAVISVAFAGRKIDVRVHYVFTCTRRLAPRSVKKRRSPTNPNLGRTNRIGAQTTAASHESFAPGCRCAEPVTRQRMAVGVKKKLATSSRHRSIFRRLPTRDCAPGSSLAGSSSGLGRPLLAFRWRVLPPQYASMTDLESAVENAVDVRRSCSSRGPKIFHELIRLPRSCGSWFPPRRIAVRRVG